MSSNSTASSCWQRWNRQQGNPVIFEISPSGQPRFSRIHPLLAELLRATTLDPWEHFPEGCARLLPPPGTDEELCADWQDHVQPELRLHFDSERAVVEADLALMKKGRGKNAFFSLEIPLDHADAWLTTLNVLRLALVGDHGLTEEDLSRNVEPDLSSPRGLALMQVNLYAFMQECLIRAVGFPNGE